MMCHELTSVSSFVSTKMHALTPRHQQQQHIEETSTRASTMRAPHALHPSIINLFVTAVAVAIAVLCVADLQTVSCFDQRQQRLHRRHHPRRMSPAARAASRTLSSWATATASALAATAQPPSARMKLRVVS
mmetsp:Transcript_11090/g.31882  ORF Transcript_11090/g.31882 Transcript_11090/m.31882 type:complete len:132 (+) Transcript_11090:339-734(+)